MNLPNQLERIKVCLSNLIMTAFFDSLRFVRKKPTRNHPTEGSAIHESDVYTNLIKGHPYEEMSQGEPRPTFGSPLEGLRRPKTALPQAERELSSHLVEISNQDLESSRAGAIDNAYVINDGYVNFTRDCGSISESTKLKAKALKMKTELFYTNSVFFAAERNKR